MKKLFSKARYLLALVSLVLLGANVAVAQTSITVTFDAVNGDFESTISVDDVLSYAGYSVAGVTNTGKRTFNEEDFVQFKQTENITSYTEDNAVFLNVVPRKGITFTPTKVSFDAIKVGTGNDTETTKRLAYGVVMGDGTKKMLEQDLSPNRNGTGSSYNGVKSSYSKEISGFEATSDNTLSIVLYIANTKDKELAFRNIVIEGTYSGEAVQETMYNINATVNIEGAGTITQTPPGAALAEGTDVTFSAKANTGFVFLNKWTVEGEEKTGETYTVENLSADINIVALFEKNPVITFAKPEDVYCVNRMFPANVVTTEKNGSYTLPNNYMYYKEGYTMTGWDVNGETKACGDLITVTEDVTLTPIFAENKVSLATQKLGVTIKYDFNPSTNGGRLVNIEGNADKFITTATIDNETIDVALAIDCNDDAGVQGSRGKVNNASATAKTAQVNPGAVFTIPVEKGSVITISGTVNFSTITFNDVTGNMDKTTVTYTAEEAGEVKVIAKEENMYYNSITVTYPKHETYVDVTSAGYRTFASGSALDFTGGVEGLTAYRAVVDGGNVSFVEIDGEVPAGEGMLIKAKEGRYYIPVATGTPDEIENDFVGVTSATEVEVVGIYVLMNGGDGLGFYKTTADKFTVSKNTAYLPAAESAARTFIALPGNETTGVNAVKSVEATDGKVFDLQGRQVSKPTKGLYISNGKKYIVK